MAFKIALAGLKRNGQAEQIQPVTGGIGAVIAEIYPAQLIDMIEKPFFFVEENRGLDAQTALCLRNT